MSQAIERNSPVPLYEQIKQILVREIAELPAGAPAVPLTERELVQRFRVSRGSVRRALQELTDEGYIYRERAKGTFPVRRVHMSPPGLGGFMRFLEERGVPFESKVSIAGRKAPSPHLRERLELGPDEDVFEIQREITVEGELLTSVHMHMRVPDDFTATATDLEASGSVFTLLDPDPEYALTQGEHTIWATAARDADARALGIAIGDPILVMETTMYTRAGRISAVRRVVHRADDYKFAFTVSR